MTEQELAALTESLEMPEAVPENGRRRHIGLRNVHRRLQVYYGSPFGIQVHSQKGEGTEVWVDIP